MTTGPNSGVHHGVFDSAIEEQKRTALVDGWFRMAEEARARGDIHEARSCEVMARKDCADDEYREYLDRVIAFYVERCPDELLQALNAR